MSFAYESNSKAFLCQVVLLLIGVLISGCASTNGPTESKLSGPLVGWAYAYYPYSSTLPVTVRLEPLGLSTETDTTGRWEFDSVSSGTYKVVFSKSGYGTMWLTGVEHLGGGATYLPGIQLNQQDTIPMLIDSIVYGRDVDGYPGYIVFSKRAIDFVADVDSLQLATDPINALVFNPRGQSFDSAIHIVITDDLIRDGIPTIRNGDFFYVIINSSSGKDAYVPLTTLTTGHWGGQPFKQPCQIIRLEYRGN